MMEPLLKCSHCGEGYNPNEYYRCPHCFNPDMLYSNGEYRVFEEQGTFNFIVKRRDRFIALVYPEFDTDSNNIAFDMARTIVDALAAKDGAK